MGLCGGEVSPSPSLETSIAMFTTPQPSDVMIDDAPFKSGSMLLLRLLLLETPNADDPDELWIEMLLLRLLSRVSPMLLLIPELRGGVYDTSDGSVKLCDPRFRLKTILLMKRDTHR